jgi:hypothetical protein
MKHDMKYTIKLWCYHHTVVLQRKLVRHRIDTYSIVITQGMASLEAVAAGLIPAQALSRAGSTSAVSSRGNQRNAASTSHSTSTVNSSSHQSATTATGGNQKQPSKNVAELVSDDTNNKNAASKKTRKRPNRRKGRATHNTTTNQENKNASEMTLDAKMTINCKPNAKQQQQLQLKKNPSSTRNNNKNKQAEKKRFPWRKHLPEDSVDPITLDSLHSLLYPPFCLVATEPYVPVPEWPIPEVVAGNNNNEDDQKRRLAEQWDRDVLPVLPTTTSSSTRHYHLFDGRALAYYMVSQLQFIDPLNRRDLTRDELVGLDRYLRTHGFECSVVEAYDTKGVTLSSAGAAANTAAGRAAILQQQASGLLRALFRGGAVVPTTTTRTGESSSVVAVSPPSSGSLRAQYEAQLQHQQPNRRQQNQQETSTAYVYDDVVYGHGGMVVIDDDLNPELRGSSSMQASARPFTPNGSLYSSGSLYSANHITSRYSQNNRTVPAHEFPSLPAARADSAQQQQPSAQELAPKKKLPPVKTLASIGKLVQKTTPEESQRQWEAREEARRKAALANLTFGSNNVTSYPTQQIPYTISTPAEPVSQGLLDRNRALAEALGVAPASIRNPLAGWARPTTLDEFGQELTLVMYPDALIIQARERMGPLLKIEKKWIKFLADDKAASLPLSAMDRPTRVFFHEYSDYWKLHTESFDPEPKRYIHCMKLLDTRAPYPLLSDAALNWKGPRPILASVPATEHASQQTAGQSTSGPTSASLERTHGAGILPGGPTRSTLMVEPGCNSRFASLAGPDRPKLQLNARTLPTELTAAESEPMLNITEDLLRQRERAKERAKKEMEIAEKKRLALESAFASDDERDEDLKSDTSSVWDEPESPQSFSDDEM